MDARIKTAASLLRSTSYDLQQRIKTLQSDENAVHRKEAQDENMIRSDLQQTEYKLAHSTGNNTRTRSLTKHIYTLFKRRRQVKEQAHKKIIADEQEIRSLKAQINRLNDLAHVLETWR